MNATSLYVSACRLIMQKPVDDNSALVDLFKAFPNLRQALSCTVCSNLLIEPYTPTESSCQHHVCRSCKGEKKKLKPSCSWCKDYSKYYENVHLRTLLQCYKKLCTYVTNSDLFREIIALTTAGSNNSTIENSKILVDIFKEGAGFKDDFNSSNINMMSFCQDIVKDSETQTDGTDTSIIDSSKLASGSTYSCYSGSGNRLTIKRENTDPIDEEKMSRLNKIRRKSAFGLMVTSCHCGLQVNPNRMTCRGYRCPCYSVDRPCFDCTCQACNNPIGANPKDSWDDYVSENTQKSNSKLDTGEKSKPVNSTNS